MFNRIRRAVSHTREQYFPKGRHRRPLMPSGPPVAYTSSGPADGSAADQEQIADTVNRLDLLRGEDVALVRPYVLAWEAHVRRRSVVVALRLSAEAWSVLTGAC